ncbi:hypothetical protein BST81_02305 [Leptolyngbya sp. 'hensonii']|uniref:hypothetical protein n=1 Tax=Leptolyngbya sp. 'hensonii' TaxID=1922337 RepID=UPI00094FA7A8|nr:hypothetical protein [Leptolyngbya sp. 'hensonii']OLP20090.1 hypothetical protein BST81_02305 [Leptolyngbya sp. 'hensonii']
MNKFKELAIVANRLGLLLIRALLQTMVDWRESLRSVQEKRPALGEAPAAAAVVTVAAVPIEDTSEQPAPEATDLQAVVVSIGTVAGEDAALEVGLPTALPETGTIGASVPNRRVQVESLLDAAWEQGLRTYPQLLRYVELSTGEACSRKTIANWKKQRGLSAAA